MIIRVREAVSDLQPTKGRSQDSNLYFLIPDFSASLFMLTAKSKRPSLLLKVLGSDVKHGGGLLPTVE
jgi:hypothetical protein